MDRVNEDIDDLNKVLEELEETPLSQNRSEVSITTTRTCLCVTVYTLYTHLCRSLLLKQVTSLRRFCLQTSRRWELLLPLIVHRSLAFTCSQPQTTNFLAIGGFSVKIHWWLLHELGSSYCSYRAIGFQ